MQDFGVSEMNRDLFYLVVLAYHHCPLPDDLVKAGTAVTALRGMTAESALRITEDRWLSLSPEAQKILRMIAPKACPATRPQLECSQDWDDFLFFRASCVLLFSRVTVRVRERTNGPGLAASHYRGPPCNSARPNTCLSRSKCINVFWKAMHPRMMTSCCEDSAFVSVRGSAP